MAQIKKEIIEHIGVIGTSSSGWKTEVNLISWNDGPAKYDIRSWNEDHSKCGKGIALTAEEFLKLKEITII